MESERLNGVLLLDAFGEDLPEGVSDVSEGSLGPPPQHTERVHMWLSPVLVAFL